MYPCKQQEPSRGFPGGLARVKRLISFKKEAGRGFASLLPETARRGGQSPDQPKTTGGLGLALVGCLLLQPASCLAAIPVPVGYGEMQTTSACFWTEGSCAGIKIKRKGSILLAHGSLSIVWDLGSGSSVKFSLACLKTAILLPKHPTSISAAAGGIRPTCQARCYLCKCCVLEGSLKNKSPFYSALDAGSKPAN